MYQLSSNLLEVAFFLYLISTFFFGGTVGIKSNKVRKSLFARIGIVLTLIGFVAQLGYFFTRWNATGHAPVSNLFEFTTFFGMMLVFAFIIMYFMYNLAVLGVFALPIALLVIAFASMFPKEISPLVPSLQSHWLPIHVSTVALGEALLAISFVAGLIYLLKNVDQSKKSKSTFWLEFIIFFLIVTIGFVVSTVTFKVMDYEAKFVQVVDGKETEIIYTTPPLLVPYKSELQSTDVFSGGLETPSIVNARKATTVIWSILFGTVIYLVIRLVLRGRISATLSKYTQNISSDLLDEISSRSIAIGFPVFTLGGLIFAMIWAQIAWGRFWGWDPKEVWALVTWLFYAAFLHLRLTKGWHGEKSAWLAVIGFFIIMFNLVAVNLVIAGLHSYA